ncbi:MAG: aminoacetone oxidase family FAD-binding enzyme, partial [Lachnospiraceae bacterium]|nr:aminoacetone oxidase family FAD-binding enzyme [Lachnospiraceae bacterium]
MGEIKRHKLIIVGCGASGMMAGCAAGLYCDDVMILDANNVPGKKLLATGNGKCNFTNIFIREDRFNADTGDGVMGIYEKFDFDDVLCFFEHLGVPVRIIDGRCYPYSREAASVRDALVSRLKELNVKIKLSNRIKDVEKDKEGDFFRVITEDGYPYEAEKVILACAGYAGASFGCDGSVYDILKGMGSVNIKKPFPALVGLKSSFRDLSELSGVRVIAKVTLKDGGEDLKSDSGEIIFASDGVSGIPVMNLSRYAARLLDEKRECSLCFDFFEEMSETNLEHMLKAMICSRTFPIEEALTGLIN